jgi:hypothetical protein
VGRSLFPCAQALIFVLAAVPQPESAEPLLLFSGNAVLNDQVYRAVLDLPREAQPTASNARLVRSRLLDFLHRAGYELAKVKTRTKGDHIMVDIDEGRVDKVIVLGQGAYKTLRVKLELAVPHNVFNRRELEQQLRELSAKYDFRDYTISLVPVEKEQHVGPQIDLGKIQDEEVVPPERPLELHITLKSQDFENGASPDIAFNSLEGVGVGVRYRARGIFAEEDRTDARARVAMTLRERIDGTHTRPVLSRAYAELRQYTPPLISRGFRSFFWLQSDLLNRQRGDLGIEGFFYWSLAGTVNFQYQFTEGVAASLGAGVEHRRLFAIDRSAPSTFVDETPRMQTRPFTVAAIDLVFNPGEVRRDRKNYIALEARSFARGEAERPHSLRLYYYFQTVKLIGWHEVWLKSRGTSLHGDSLFPDEQSIGGGYLRGPFSRTYYVRRLVSASVDFRVSLIRDRFKVSVFHDLVGFGMIDRVENQTRGFDLANAFGLGFHALMIDAFQLDAYYGVGFAPVRNFDHGFQLSIQQAF